MEKLKPLIRFSKFAITVILLLSLAGYTDKPLLITELASHFRLQYLVISILCLIPLQITKNYIWSIACVTVFIMNAVAVFPIYLAEDKEYPNNPDAHLKILMSNLHTGNLNQAGILTLVDKERPDLIILMEVTNNWLERLEELDRHYPYGISEPRDDNFGIAVFSRIPLKKTDVVKFGKAGLPSIMADLSIEGNKIRLIGTHPMPPLGSEMLSMRDSQMDDMASFIKNQNVPVILAGDLNMTMWSPDFETLMKRTGLHNARRGFGIIPTWPVKMPFLMIPLDHFLHDSSIFTESIRSGPDIGSDHFPIIAEFVMK